MLSYMPTIHVPCHFIFYIILIYTCGLTAVIKRMLCYVYH